MIYLKLAETALLTSAGLETPFDAESLKHGRNNQVFRVSDASGRQVILKRFFQNPDDPRDRLKHEWAFLNYAVHRAPGMVPQPLARDASGAAMVLEAVEGSPSPTEIGRPEVVIAAEFVRHLNPTNAHEDAASLPHASEACFAPGDHERLLRRRLHMLESIPADSDLHMAARKFARAELEPAATAAIEAARRGSIAGVEHPTEIVSPSDFGFHNAIRRPNDAICFIDFEYAGRDSLGKLIADFFSQPRRPVDLKHLRAFMTEIQGFERDAENHEAAMRYLSPLLAIHSLKWCCIMLNDFLPTGNTRRQFAADDDAENDVDRQREQLAAAKAYYESICRPRLDALG